MTDILIDNTDLDLVITNGDLQVGESTQQHQQLLLLTSKGDWKERPTIAVGAAGFLKDESDRELLTEIKTEFERDGMEVIKIKVDGNKILIDANY